MQPARPRRPTAYLHAAAAAAATAPAALLAATASLAHKAVHVGALPALPLRLLLRLPPDGAGGGQVGRQLHGATAVCHGAVH